MVKIAAEYGWSLVCQQSSQVPTLQEQVLAARVAIVAAKVAYRTESELWLSLLSKAVSAVDACPEPIRSNLNRELMCVSLCEVKVGVGC